MSANVLTPATLALLSPWDLALLAKALLRRALALYDVSHAQLARLLGLESTARVDAALSDTRDNAVPLWWFAHPAFPAQVRAHVFEELSRLTAREPAAAETPERQLRVALQRVGHFVTIAAATVDESRLSTDSAGQLLRVVDSTRGALDGLAARLRQRVSTGGYPAAGGRR
jgi:hypothetical protein